LSFFHVHSSPSRLPVTANVAERKHAAVMVCTAIVPFRFGCFAVIFEFPN
jgi:hypothetical protein